MKIWVVRVHGIVQLQISLFNLKPHIVLTSQVQIFLRWLKKNPSYKSLEHINNQRFKLNFNAAAKEQKMYSFFKIFIYLLFEAHERTSVNMTSSQYLPQW